MKNICLKDHTNIENVKSSTLPRKRNCQQYQKLVSLYEHSTQHIFMKTCRSEKTQSLQRIFYLIICQR